MHVRTFVAHMSPDLAADRTVRVLLVADTHIGFDKPRRPRIERRRRGDDFMANFCAALEPALRGEVDLVVHGGDLLFRSRVPPGLVEEALAPLARVAEAGVPVYLVPGNHERSRIPRTLLTGHPNLHIFHEPCTFVHQAGGVEVALSGFPFLRDVDERFDDAVAATGWADAPADVRLLCLHQSVEGAQVGPSDFTFRRGKDVVSGSAIPAGFAAILSGHIHRSQVLTHDLRRRPMAAPVVYPGSVERTSFAEKDEQKHYAVMQFAPDATHGGELVSVQLVPLPARPMVTIRVDGAEHVTVAGLSTWLEQQLQPLPADAVVRVQVDGDLASQAAEALSSPNVRAIAPPTMNITVGFSRSRSGERRTTRRPET